MARGDKSGVSEPTGKRQKATPQARTGAAPIKSARAGSVGRDRGSGKIVAGSSSRASGVFRKEQAPRSHVAFADSILRELSVRDPDGTRLGASTDVQQAAALAAERVLDPALLWLEHLGAFYDTDGVRSLLARDGEPVSRQAVHKRKGLLALTTGSGRVVYPAFQFQDRKLVPGLDRILAVLPEALISRWTLASWLVSPEAELDGERPIDVLAAGDESTAARAVQAARNWSAQLVG